MGVSGQGWGGVYHLSDCSDCLKSSVPFFRVSQTLLQAEDSAHTNVEYQIQLELQMIKYLLYAVFVINCILFANSKWQRMTMWSWGEHVFITYMHTAHE